jgi:hypothetical protein
MRVTSAHAARVAVCIQVSRLFGSVQSDLVPARALTSPYQLE